MKQVVFGGTPFQLHPAGVLWQADARLLAVADLHLEKGSHFARRGFFLPPYDTHETLAKLGHVVTALNPARVLVLGDCFHDPAGFDRMAEPDKLLFGKLLGHAPIWVRGNHDGMFVPHGFEAHAEYEWNGIVFRHQALANTALPEISGHYHPKARVKHKGAAVSRPCFVECGNRLILPAFGAYTGGLFADDPAIRIYLDDCPRLHLLGENRIFTHAME